jgi:hypothetical protein
MRQPSQLKTETHICKEARKQGFSVKSKKSPVGLSLRVEGLTGWHFAGMVLSSPWLKPLNVDSRFCHISGSGAKLLLLKGI